MLKKKPYTEGAATERVVQIVRELITRGYTFSMRHKDKQFLITSVISCDEIKYHFPEFQVTLSNTSIGRCAQLEISYE